MSNINETDVVKKQYDTADKLNIRIAIHSKYSTNKQGFGSWIYSHYDIQKDMSLLELGCGTGDMWVGRSSDAALCKQFVLSDFSEAMIHQTKEKLHGCDDNIDYRVIDIQDIPFADEQFDIVIANMMLYHVPDLNKGLSEVRRVLKKDGRFFCATFGENGMMEHITRMFRDYGAESTPNRNFNLQNGEEKLAPYFSSVTRCLYNDSLEVTDISDMADYIYTLTGMSALQGLPRETVMSVLEANTKDGILTVPKDYGMFVCIK